MNRRDFLKRFGIGVSAALALASLPASAIEGLTTAEAGKRCATEYLLRVYRAWCNAHTELPTRMEAGAELFEAFEGELIENQRFCYGEWRGPGTPINLMFKGARLDCVGRGWTAKVIAEPYPACYASAEKTARLAAQSWKASA